MKEELSALLFVVVASIIVALMLPIIIYWRHKLKQRKCRFANDCNYYYNCHTCNHDKEAITYCGIAKERIQLESLK